jgi:hypothetical protein
MSKRKKSAKSPHEAFAKRKASWSHTANFLESAAESVAGEVDELEVDLLNASVLAVDAAPSEVTTRLAAAIESALSYCHELRRHIASMRATARDMAPNGEG